MGRTCWASSVSECAAEAHREHHLQMTIQFHTILFNSIKFITCTSNTTYNCITIVILFCESNRVTHLKTRISSYIKYISAIAMAKQVGPEHWGKGNLLWSPTGSTTWSLQSTILYMLIWYTYG